MRKRNRSAVTKSKHFTHIENLCSYKCKGGLNMWKFSYFLNFHFGLDSEWKTLLRYIIYKSKVTLKVKTFNI